MTNDALSLSSAVNRVQGHVHNRNYCLKVNKTTKQEECRFWLPDEIRDHAKLQKHPAPGREWLWFFPARNDGMINKYNRLTTMAWQANTDVSPCTDPRAVIEYVVKYATKAEKKSPAYRDLAATLVPFVNEARPFQSLVTKLLNKLIGDRDYSAQEVCHYLLDLPLRHSSRSVVSVDLRPEEHHSHFYRIEGEETRRGLSLLEKYKERIDTDENVTYICFLRCHDHRKPYGLRPRAKERILTYFPRYSPEDTENFGRAKLMLHHPFREVKDLLHISHIHNHAYGTFTEAYAECQALCGDTHDRDGLSDLDFDQNAGEEIHEPTQEGEEEDNIDAEWTELARQLPNRDTGANIDLEDNLGLREMDSVDWSDRVGKYPNLNRDWWKCMKHDFPVTSGTSTTGVVPFDNLEKKQQLAHRLFTKHCSDWCQGMFVDQLLIQMEGEGGTGKTTVVHSICESLDKLAHDAGKLSPVLRAAPTGVAAHNIGGQTLHSLFRLPVKRFGYQALPSGALTALQTKFRHINYLVIDEKSMVSLIQLSWINIRLQEIKANDEDFGGINILLIGDFCQLPPVAAQPLFWREKKKKNPEAMTEREKEREKARKNKAVNADIISGQRLYRLFDRTITLNVVKRQQGTNAEAVAFRNALANLRMNKSTVMDWQLLSSRVRAKVALKEDLSRFDDAVHIYQHREDVHAYNHQRLRDLNNPVLPLRASHRGHGAEGGSTEEAGNLAKHLHVSINSRIMLGENIWADHALFNGAVGIIRDIVWDVGADSEKDPPLALLVAFDGYDGPELLRDPETNAKLVPIFRSSRDWVHGSVTCVRTQFPVTLAYAITVHKSQGISLDCAVLNLSGSQDFAAGLTYVAISRVRSLSGLLFDEPFGYVYSSPIHRTSDSYSDSRESRLLKLVIPSSPAILITHEERRLKSLSPFRKLQSSLVVTLILTCRLCRPLHMVLVELVRWRFPSYNQTMSM
jgi:hypothetical protein